MATGKIQVAETDIEVTEGQNPNVSIAVTEQNVTISEAVVGLQGPSGDKHYQHDQSVPSATWTITHNLGKKPAVSVIDSGGNEWQTAVQHISNNQCVLRFSSPFSGVAFLN